MLSGVEDLFVTGKLASILVACAGWLVGTDIAAAAEPVFARTQVIGATVQSDARLPAPVEFQIAVAGDYRVTLTDLATPAALSSLQAIVTRDLNVVARLTVTTTASAPATQTFNATPGAYHVHVLGVPAAALASGAFGLKVAPAGGGTPLMEHADVIVAAPAPGDGMSVLQTTFGISQDASHRLVITDLGFPAALASTQTLLLRLTSGDPVIVPINGGIFSGTPGTYQLLIVARASLPSLAGLYSVIVDTGQGTPAVFRSTQRVGNLPQPTSVTITTAGTHTLTLADASFPASLTSLAGVAVQKDTVKGTLSAAGTASLGSLDAGVLEIYVRGVPAPSEEIGTFSVTLVRGTQTLVSQMRIVDSSADPKTPAIFATESLNPVAAGNYQMNLKDFGLPQPFVSLKGAVTQGAAVVGTFNGTGTAQFTLNPGPVKILIAARPPIDTGSGNAALFGMTLAPGGGGDTVLETTQGVGSLFRVDTVSIDAAGSYDLLLKDLEFPAAMQTAALVVTRGTTLTAQILGSGSVPRQSLSTGTYVLNFLGEPATSSAYGAYGIRVAQSAAQPTVTLSANPASVTAGQSTTLQWSSTDATTCSATGGWSGTKTPTGSQPVGPLNANSTFGLNCTGPGGSGTASVAVNVAAPSPGGRGGGGAMGLWWMVGMGGLVGLRRVRRSDGATK